MNDKEIEGLKRLKSNKIKELNQLKADKEMYCQLLKQIDKKIEEATKEVERLNNVYSGITKYDYLTDHALVRYLERSGVIDAATIKKNLMNDTLASGLIGGANKVMIGGFEFVVKNGRVVTSIDR